MDDLGIQIVQIPPFDQAIREHWEVSANDIDLFGFSALCEPAMQYPWSLCINVAEFIRHEPLDTEFRTRLVAALSGVAGVTAIEEADQDVWVVAGEPSGQALVDAVLLLLLDMAAALSAELAQVRGLH